MHRHLGTPPKEVVWVGSSLDDLRRLPRDAQHRAGSELWAVQCGDRPSDWRPMPAIGAGVIYVATIADVIHVLHVFEKKTRKTRLADIELAQRRLAWARTRAKMRAP